MGIEMNAKEHAEKLAAARAEVARLEAIVPEKEKPGMVLPYGNADTSGWWNFSTIGFRVGMSSEEQLAAYEDAFHTMLLMRAQKGIVNPVVEDHWFVCADIGGVTARRDFSGNDDMHACMFPCFATEADALAAIAAVGEDRIIRCAKWLAGCV